MEHYAYGTLGFWFAMVLFGFLASCIATIAIGLYITD